MALRPNHSLVGQGIRLGFVVFIVIHVLISAWLVIDFEGEYTEGAPAPTKINAIAVVDSEETLIDVKMERSTSFILYMLYRDYDSSYEVNETTEDNSTILLNEEQDDDTKDSSSSSESETDWLKFGRNTTFAFMILLIASEILMFFALKYRSVIRFLCWFGLILCFTVVMPTTYVFDLAGDGEKADDKSYEESLSEENFVDSTEIGSIAHEEYSFDSKLIAFGVKFDMDYSGYDLGLVEPKDYETLRQEKPANNSTLEDSYIAFDSNLELKYGKNLPSLFLIPIAWYVFPSKSRNRNMSIKDVNDKDISRMIEINEQGLPGTGKVNQQEMQKLLELSELALGVFDDRKLLGFVICLLPKTEYGSLNYAWFNERYDEFIYVDRIAVATNARNQGIGSMLYDRVFQYAITNDIPVTAEVSLRPPNQGSDRFHLRHGYQVVGELDHGEKAVTMYIKHFPSSDD